MVMLPGAHQGDRESHMKRLWIPQTGRELSCPRPQQCRLRMLASQFEEAVGLWKL